MPTIFALSSGAPPSAIAIMRLSGPDAFAATRALAGDVPMPRVAALRALRNPDDGRLLDRALVVTFPGPHSATGEDVVELHVHGSRAVIAAMDRTLGMIPGLRRAEAGEFTRRALMNGRIDLTEAEGLGDLLAAETEAQRRQALLVAEGGLRRLVAAWNDRLVWAAAMVEAALDFADEDDVPADTATLITSALFVMARDMNAMLAVPPVERLRDGIRVVIAGPPNSGKSTLLNALAGRDAAIVTAIAGTTRDVIEVPVTRQGVSYVFCDTAGLRDAPADAVEAIGIARAVQAVAVGDIILWLGDVPPDHPRMLWLHTRTDQPGRAVLPPGRLLGISAATGAGLDDLWQQIEATARTMLPRENDMALNARQRRLMAQCCGAIEDAVSSNDMLILAEHLRLALRALDALTGRAGVEDVLDSIFGNFCIGK